jgi:hypothetical protein
MFEFALMAFWIMCGSVCLLITLCVLVGVLKIISKEMNQKRK